MDTCSDPISHLEDNLSKELEQFLTEKCTKLSGLRVKRKPNQDGDVHIPAFTRHMVPKQTNITSDQFDLLPIIQKITTSPCLGKYISNINISSNGQLNLCLNKAAITKAIICNVMSKGVAYGKITQNNVYNGSFILNSNVLINSNGNQPLSSLDCLRMVITLGHLKNLLCANGISAEITSSVLPKEIISRYQSTLNGLSLFYDEIVTTSQSEYKDIVQTIQQTLQKSQFVTNFDVTSQSREQATEDVGQQSTGKNMCFDCQMYRENSNFHPVNITQSLIYKLSALELAARHKDVKSQPCQVLHVTCHRKLYTSQQHGLVWKAISHDPLSQVYLSLGNITTYNIQQAQQLGVKELLRIRENQLRSAYLLKYGDIVQGPGWEDSIRSVAVATLKLQIMAASQNNQVKIDVSEKAQDYRQATFIMYNCARLSKLFQHYEDSVQQGQYPPLPSVEEIDFNLLREKDEWNLLLRYVTQYPSVVRDAVHSLLTTNESVVTTNINKVCCFLLDLSQDFSSYYGRTHVLGEPRPHLFPTMFARLYLLKAIQQVLHNGLALLDIQPLTQM